MKSKTDVLRSAKQLTNNNRRIIASRKLARLPISSFPKPLERVGRNVSEFRRAVEALALERFSEVGLVLAATITTACMHETRRLMAVKEIRCGYKAMSLEQRLMVIREAALASEARDKALRLAGLDSPAQKDPFDGIELPPPVVKPSPASGSPAVQDVSEAAPTAVDVPEAASGPVEESTPCPGE